MKLTRKLLCLLLALAMILPMVPNPARAEEAVPQAGVVIEELPVQINPLYEGLITEADLEFAEAPEFDPSLAQPHATYTTIEKGGAEVRKNLKNRAETFVVYVKTPSSSLQNICDEMVEIALEHTGKATEGDYIMWQYGGWKASSRRSWNSGTQDYSYDITFTVSYYTTADQEKEMDTAVTNLINSLGVRYKTDYEKVCAVYDWICDNVTYDYENLEDTSYTRKHTAYAALMDKTAVCQGYALLFYRLMLELGVDNRLIAGLGNGGAHGWNIVELDNLYYDVDSTWDAGRDTYNYFLRTDSTFGDHSRYFDYATLDFLTTYPMSAKDYVKGEKSEAIDVLFGGQCGDDAYWEIDMDRELTIFGTGAVYDYPYSAVAERLPPWHYWEEELYTIVVEEGITVLGNYTFCEQINLTKVTLPSTLKEIRDKAFLRCEKLASINIPDGVTLIEGAFEGCGLTSIVIPDSVKDLDLRCFKDCVKLKTVVLGTGLTEIKYATFSNCDSLTSISLPNTITSIGEEAFYGCDSLREITIPAGVKSMGRNSLSGCSSLEKVVFKGKTDLTSGVFSQYNEKLKTVYFYGAAPQFAYNTFFGLTVTCYYPKGSPSWTEEVRQQYEGKVTWVAMNVTCAEHDYEAVVTAPTCQERGYTTYTCAVCGESYVGDYVDKLDHEYEGIVTAPTCTEQGYTTYTCTNCGESYVGDYTDPIPHSYETVITEPTCSEQGYTTYTCKHCGESYVDDYTDPVDHSYEDGTCIWCGDEVYTAEWKSATTSLNGTIDLNIYVVLSENLMDEEDAFVRFTYANKVVDVPIAEGIESVSNGVLRYRYSCPMYAKEVSQVVTVQVMKGDEVIGSALEYSIVTYCMNRINKSTNPAQVELCKALLNYAAAAQISLNYNTENLANAELDDADKVLPENIDVSGYKSSVTGSETGIKAKSATLMLESEVSVRVYFTLEEGYTVDDFVFTIDGKVVQPQKNNIGWFIETDGIAAKNLDQMLRFSVGGLTVTYGPMSYVNSKLSVSNEDTVNLAKALYAYWQSAEALLG